MTMPTSLKDEVDNQAYVGGGEVCVRGEAELCLLRPTHYQRQLGRNKSKNKTVHH